MTAQWDAVVIGVRCAGSSTARLLARAGHKVLLVDRAKFPSDTISTHLLHPPAIAALERWGLLDRLRSTGCPPIDRYSYDFGPFTISGAPGKEGRRRRTQLADRTGRATRAVQRKAEGPGELLHLLQQSTYRRFRNVHPSPSRMGGDADERRTDRGDRGQTDR